MQDAASDEVARKFLKQIRSLMEEATSVAIAADTCADHGSIDAAVRIVMDFEDPAARARDIFRALLLLKPSFADAEER